MVLASALLFWFAVPHCPSCPALSPVTDTLLHLKLCVPSVSSPVTSLSSSLSLLQRRSNFIFSVRLLESPFRSGNPNKACTYTPPALSPMLPLHPLRFPCCFPALFTCSFTRVKGVSMVYKQTVIFYIAASYMKLEVFHSLLESRFIESYVLCWRQQTNVWNE